MNGIIESGKCRMCGCTEENPCVYTGVGYDEEGQAEPIREWCGWFDADRTLCTNPDCIGKITIAELQALTPAAGLF